MSTNRNVSFAQDAKVESEHRLVIKKFSQEEWLDMPIIKELYSILPPLPIFLVSAKEYDSLKFKKKGDLTTFTGNITDIHDKHYKFAINYMNYGLGIFANLRCNLFGINIDKYLIYYNPGHHDTVSYTYTIGNKKIQIERYFKAEFSAIYMVLLKKEYSHVSLKDDPFFASLFGRDRYNLLEEIIMNKVNIFMPVITVIENNREIGLEKLAGKLVSYI